MTGATPTNWHQALHDVFLTDQAEAASEDAAITFGVLAGARGTNYSGRPSPWLLRLVRRARRNRCPHWPQEGKQVVYLPAHLPRLECKQCARETSERLPRSPDGVRCDLCREAVPLEVFAFQVGTLLVTGRCCAGCRPAVYGDVQ